MTEQALREGKCVVIGLQSTGEARTVDVIAERGEELDDFVSGPKVLPLTIAVSLALSTLMPVVSVTPERRNLFSRGAALEWKSSTANKHHPVSRHWIMGMSADWQSAVQELLLKLVEDHYPLPLDPDDRQAHKNGKASANGKPPQGPKNNKRKKPAAAEAAVKPGPQKRSRQKGSKASEGEYANGWAASNGNAGKQCSTKSAIS